MAATTNVPHPYEDGMAEEWIGGHAAAFQKGSEIVFAITLSYCTEAVGAVVRYGFEERGLNRIEARHMRRNPASGRVMAKAGMKLEGVPFEDMAIYAILASDLDPPLNS